MIDVKVDCGYPQGPGKGSLGDQSPAACSCFSKDAAKVYASNLPSREPGSPERGASARKSLDCLTSNRCCCRLEFALTACKQRIAYDSNRRKSAIYSFAKMGLQVPLAIAFLIDPIRNRINSLWNQRECNF